MSHNRKLFTASMAVVFLMILSLLYLQSNVSEAAPDPHDGNSQKTEKALDVLSFGNDTSESRHDFDAETSRVYQDEKGEKLRRLLPADKPENRKKRLGSMSFTMTCDPSNRTYLTIKFAAPDSWKPKHTSERLMLFDGDDMIGYLHGQGAWVPLDFGLTRGRERAVKATHSDYWYATHRVPRYMTKGNKNVDLRVVSWNAQGPSQRIYRAYTHTKPLFRLPSEDQDHNLDTGTVAGPDSNPIAPVVDKVNKQVRKYQDRETVGTIQALGLAVAYSRGEWIDTVDQDAILKTVKSTIDHYTVKQAESSPSDVFSRGWEPHGELARAYSLLHDAFEQKGLLSEPLTNHPDGKMNRREAYTQFFDRALTWRSKDRRPIYNQTILVSLGLVRMSYALRKLNPEQAPDQTLVDRWIDEAIGLTGLTHREGEKPRSMFLSGSYYMATEAGMPKEAGYVMDYGCVGLRETAKLALETGLDRVKKRYQEMARARSHFRWLVRQIKTGHRWSAIDGVLSRRHLEHPGRIGSLKGYGINPFVYVKVSDDEVTKRWAELVLEHGVQDHRSGRLHLSGLIYHVEGYRRLKQLEPSDYVLPMNRERSVWADPDMGQLSITDGDDRLMINLNHSASGIGDDWGVNHVARVHYHGSRGDRVMMVDMKKVEFPFAGGHWERPNHLFRPSHFLSSNAKRNRYLPWKGKNGTVNQAMAGQKLRQASRPNGEPWPAAERDDRNWRTPDPRVGMGIHYREFRIGPYLIGMNSTGAPKRGFGKAQTFEMEVPEGAAINLATGETVNSDTVTVGPRETVVLKIEE